MIATMTALLKSRTDPAEVVLLLLAADLGLAWIRSRRLAQNFVN
jgi:hypothetical protein